MDTTGRDAFHALQADVGKRALDPNHRSAITLEQRSAVIAYAETYVNHRTGRIPPLNKLALGRVQALWVAGALATLDGPGVKTPFKESELTSVYQRQQQYILSVAALSQAPLSAKSA